MPCVCLRYFLTHYIPLWCCFNIKFKDIRIMSSFVRLELTFTGTVIIELLFGMQLGNILFYVTPRYFRFLKNILLLPLKIRFLLIDSDCTLK